MSTAKHEQDHERRDPADEAADVAPACPACASRVAELEHRVAELETFIAGAAAVLGAAEVS